MGNENEKLHVSMTYDEAQTIPLALHEMHMARHNRLLRWLCVAWAISVVLIVGAFVWLWNQYDYESSTTTEYSGVYNITDSEGNVITSDLTPEDVIRIMETLNGESEKNQNQNP